MNTWVIVTDDRRVAGLLKAARVLGGPVKAVVAGPAELATTVATMGFDQVAHLASGDVLAEAYAAPLAEVAASEAPRLVLSTDAATARVLLGAVAAKLGAVVIGALRSLATDGDVIVASHAIAGGRLVEDVAVSGVLAAIYDGDDAPVTSQPPIAVEPLVLRAPQAAPHLVEVIPPDGSGGLLTATRVVGVGMGLKSKDDLGLIRQLADAVHATLACTLPLCDDVRWLPADLVVGSSHNQIAPALYIAVGISGQPQHMSGVRDAKTVVAINNDPAARIFACSDYGIVGDLYKIVPELISAFTNQ